RLQLQGRAQKQGRPGRPPEVQGVKALIQARVNLLTLSDRPIACNVNTAIVTFNADRSAAPDANTDVALAAAGDASAFERLYRSHVAKVHSLARRMLGPGDADEVTQDIFVRTWQKLHTFRGDAAFSTWLHRLAVNVVIERRRSYAVQRERIDDDPAALDRITVPPTRGDLTVT